MTDTNQPRNAIARLVAFLPKTGAGLFGGLVLAIVVVLAALADVIAPGDPLNMVARPVIWPFVDPAHVLGTDALGRDMASMIVHGARFTLIVGFAASIIATLIGTMIGAVAGYYGGRLDAVLMRLTEVFQSVPAIVLLLAIVSVTGPDAFYLTLGIGMASWTGIARVARAQFMSLKTREFVLASKALGARDWRLIVEEILPNAAPAIIVLASLNVASAVLYEAAIAFLGFGDPDMVSWGRIMGEGRPLLRTAWFASIIPGIAIFLTVLALNQLGDSINDALNPRLRIAGSDAPSTEGNAA